MKYVSCFLFVFLITQLHAQTNGLLKSGPMLGYIEHREVLIWLEVTPEVREVEIRYQAENGDKCFSKKYDGVLQKNFNPIKMVLDGLDMNTVYNYDIWLNGMKMETLFKTTFKTKELWEWRKDAPDFSFLFGSCFYVNDSLYDRPGKPYGNDLSILDRMAEMPTDFMIWGGDNLYYREADYSSAYGLNYRYSYNFSIPQMQKLRGTRANFAIWDDHDFGPNNSGSSYELKDIALEVFKNNWGNKTFGEADNAGVYTKFQWSDAEFFLCDNRYYRDDTEINDSIGGKPNPNKKHMGAAQMKWLKNSLAFSKSVFKIIVIGGQVLNPMNDYEGLQQYPLEYAELINFIQEEKINGVVFLSGDRHFTELEKFIPKGGYPLYDLTSSSVTAGVYDISKSKEFNNPSRVEGTLFMKNNFARLSVTGAKKDRSLMMEIFDVNGAKVWDYKIHQNELSF
jgi:alkaline phosphatase D